MEEERPAKKRKLPWNDVIDVDSLPDRDESPGLEIVRVVNRLPTLPREVNQTAARARPHHRSSMRSASPTQRSSRPPERVARPASQRNIPIIQQILSPRMILSRMPRAWSQYLFESNPFGLYDDTDDDIDEFTEDRSYEYLSSIGDLLGQVKRKGATSEAIKSVPQFSYKSLLNPSEFQCAVCLDSARKTQNFKKLRCSHIYHSSCINKWLKVNANCPVCRINL